MELQHAAKFRGKASHCMRLCMQLVVVMVACRRAEAQAGDYSTFVSLMIETKVDEVFQRNANQTEIGITIFAPSNGAFTTKLASSLLSNLTDSQKVSLVEYHALTSWVSLGSLQLADDNQTATLATYNNGGGQYQLNLTNIFGMVQVVSAWTVANLTSTLYSQRPVSIFGINQVLLPEDLFGLPSPAPAPSPSSGAPTPTPLVPSSSSSTLGPSGSDGSANFSPTPIAPSLTPLFVCFLVLVLLPNMHL
ncbi:hypothetical protein GOP47_0014885 [Adiantum capillus-veneris]|uniref:FAS1 domain-containing protein n=1 Tax=Adiantum capillus-veneris TaxID=13818 RepID=A0A9D4UN71_ADICA|nr:hypothetical protein GOP47_0014885 [Adiantum capillus-veneris]